MNGFIEDLRWRGLIHQTTDEAGFGAWLDERPRTLYAGFDPTADSLHVGHLVSVLLLRRFQAAGHRPIAVVGGATGMIGDPSGKSEERNLLSREQLAANVAALERQMGRFLEFSGPAAARLVNNHDWAGKWSFLDFLRDIGKNFPVNVMLAKDSVRARLESEAGLSYTEFSYMLLQAYDFVHLNQAFGCELQVGGSDQWGNITAGIDLGRRMHGARLQGLTTPLLLKSDGTKMGKTEGGALWLDARRTSPYLFYQYWVNLADDDVGRVLRFFSDRPRAELEAIEAEQARDPAKRTAQRAAAEELTRLVHGDEGLERARRASAALFGGPLDAVPAEELSEIFADVPSSRQSRTTLEAGWPVIEALVATGLCKTKSDARRALEEGGGYVNNVRAGLETKLTPGDLLGGRSIVLRRGKNKYALVTFE